MNHLTNLYKHKCEQLQEQIYRLTRMLNEAEGAVDPTVIQRAPNTTSYVDRSYQDRDSGQWTNFHGNPIPGSPSGPNYNWPLGSGREQGFNFDINNPNLTQKDFFPPGLSPYKGPNPRDYAGGEKNEQYEIDRDAWERAVEAWDLWYKKHMR